MSVCKTQFVCSIARAVACFVLFCVVTSRLAMAQAPTSIKLDMTINIDAVGNADVNYDLSMPAKPYAMLKSTFGDAFHVIRSMQSGSSWLELKNVNARFEDQLQSVVSHCEASGLLRTTAPGKWSFNIGGMDDGFELLDIHDNQAIFACVPDSNFGIMRMYTRVNLPRGSSNVKFDSRRGNLTYDFEPKLVEGKRASASYELKAQEHIMSSLARLYGTEESGLFAAKNIFTNDGDQMLHDYRVRFRIDGYSSWSPWKKCKVVYPGQTVLDSFYPVLDIDKLAELNGTRHAMVETEFEYTQTDGEKVSETDASRVQILSRNEVIYSSRRNGENLNWFESFDLAPWILASFTNGTDPVMQQFAGRVSALAGGPASSLDSEHAIAFLNTMWKVLQSNHLAYQTSPGLTIDNFNGQHVKYGRDVLRNRAGTCIDLAILWASAAESVGLKPYIVVIPGHAFPMIELPNGNRLPIESTMIGSATLEEAVNQGLETLKKAEAEGLIMIVDINDLKSNQNVGSLDLPKVSEDVLVKWGYNLDELINQPVTETQEVETQETNTTTHTVRRERTTESTPANPCLGDWQMIVQHNGVEVRGGQRFMADGSYACVMINSYPNGTQETITEVGRYIDQGTHFEFHTDAGDYNQRYRWVNGCMEMEFPELNVWIRFSKAE